MVGLREQVHFLNHYVDSPGASMALVIAGFAPNILSLTSLQYIYFMVILPPAIYHGGVWFLRQVIQPIYDWYRNRQDKSG